MTLTTLLVLSDGRFPSGGHAHSGGLEPVAALGGVVDVDSLGAFLRGRLLTAGLVGAAVAAAAATLRHDWVVLDAEATARMASPAVREASRRQGRQLLRTAAAAWPGPVLDGLARACPGGAHHAVVLGATAAAGGLGPGEAAVSACYSAVSGPATAAVRLLGLDPLAVNALLADLSADVDDVAAAAAAFAGGPPAELPCTSAPMLDIAAEAHADWEVRLFAS